CTVSPSAASSTAAHSSSVLSASFTALTASSPLPGSSGSTTMTVLVTVASFPAASVTVYTTSYSPGSSVFTSPDISISSVKSPSTSSSAVAPGSTYSSPTSNSIGLSPFRVISGGVVSSSAGSLIGISFKTRLSLFSVGLHVTSTSNSIPATPACTTVTISPAVITTSPDSPAVKSTSIPPSSGTLNSTVSSSS